MSPIRHAVAAGVCVLVAAGSCDSSTLHRDMTGAESLINTAEPEVAPAFDDQGFGEVIYSRRSITRVGLMWDADPGTVLQVRFADADLSWSRWQPLEPIWSDGAANVGEVLADLAAAHHVQMRLTDGPAPGFVLAESIEPDDDRPALVTVSPEDDDTAKTDVGRARQALTVPGLDIVPRSGWGAAGPRCSYDHHTPKRITIHHTATPYKDSISASARLRQIQSYHQKVRHFCDIGYHFMIDRDGIVYDATPETKRGAHVKDNNTGNVGISFIGTYNGNNRPSALQLTRAAQLMRGLEQAHGISLVRSIVRGHREYRGNASGDCPGDRIEEKIDDMLAPDAVTVDGVPAGCEALPAPGGVIDDVSSCVRLHAEDGSWRQASAGHGGSARWTYVVSGNVDTWGQWMINVSEAGNYLLEVHTVDGYASSKQARYVVRHAGCDTEVKLDQSAATGWRELGLFDFVAGGEQEVALYDATGESYSLKRRITFDALRLTRSDDPICPPIPATGGVIDEQSSCVRFHSSRPELWRRVEQGYGNTARWTYAWHGDRDCWAEWLIELEQAGDYQVEVHTISAYATSKKARYLIEHAGQQSKVVVDLSGGDGWRDLGVFDFAAGSTQRVELSDSTGESSSLKRRLTVDALRLTPAP